MDDERSWLIGPDGAQPEVGRPCGDRVALPPGAVLRAALERGWASYVPVHTHPGGGPPSLADHAMTRRLIAAGAVVGVQLATHLVRAPGATWVVTGERR